MPGATDRRSRDQEFDGAGVSNWGVFPAKNDIERDFFSESPPPLFIPPRGKTHAVRCCELFSGVGQHVRRGVQIAAVLDLSGDHMPAGGALDRPDNVYELMYTRVFSPGENAC